LEDVGQQFAVEGVSILKEHRVIASLRHCVPNSSCEAEFVLTDSSGKRVAGTDAPFRFTPTATNFHIWMAFVPDYKIHKAGRWQWTVKVTGGETFLKEFTILPPAPAQVSVLALHEQAREAAFRAFANYWLGQEGSYYAMFRRKPEPNPTGTPLWLLQIAGVAHNLTSEHLSPADGLNGITYRGRASFWFRVYRYFEPDSGWGAWQDVTRYDNSFSEVLGNMKDHSIPAGFKGHNLGFKLEQKDGHWYVWTDRGDLCVNGKGIERSEHSVDMRPPELSVLNYFIENGKSPRRRDKELGDDAKTSPEQWERNIINTTTQLRGGPLAQ
jgi:hypothetical protein